ncbi:MAG: peptide chain release factor N(5)-glutamine methyltransferase [Defluviicoccus sp.]|nr:peptide chain release factor N(5)-glutamine methyltransferase [Defluviicoccus sp.]
MSRTVEALLREAGRRLAGAGIAAPRGEARVLLQAALGQPAEALVRAPEAPVAAARAHRFDALIARRAQREPVSRILGKREFWSLEFAVCEDTLDPRPDSEAVVAAALRWCAGRSGRIRALDLGTGTGCLLLAVLSELPDAAGVGTDIAAGAVATAARNAAALGLAERASFRRADWDSGIEGGFDLVLGNPPYIPGAAIDRLEPEIARWEPRTALDGGADGLDAYRRMAPAIARRLAPSGAAFVEIGAGQEGAVEAIMAAAGLERFARHADLAGTVRCLAFACRG